MLWEPNRSFRRLSEAKPEKNEPIVQELHFVSMFSSMRLIGMYFLIVLLHNEEKTN